VASADLEQRARSGDARAQIGLAERLDAEGRHDEAISWLSRAAKGGEAAALAALGFRLLEGLNAPFLPREGAGLLSDAAQRGNAEAAAMISVLAGGGFHGPQSWPVALDYLARSASLGGTSAQAQLRLLSGEDESTDWRRLSQSVDLAAWLLAPPGQLINPAPRVSVFPDLVSAPICDFIVGQSRPRLERAMVDDPETGRPIMGRTRTNRVASFGLRDTTLLYLLIQAKIAAAAGVAAAQLEAFAVLHYGVGEEASEHFDYLDPQVPAYAQAIASHGQRVATCLLYLNEGYAGGETAFPTLGVAHHGGKGEALVFASVDAAGAPDPRTLHAGRPPSSGEKWVLSQFIRDRAMAPGAE
jgi:hypothetical protein